MVTVIQEQNPYAQAAEKFGKGLTQGYINRSDEMALKNAVEKLGPDASPKDVLNTLVGTNTYGREAKQEAIKNYIGIQEFEANQKKLEVQEKKIRAEAEIQKSRALIAEAQLEEKRRTNNINEKILEKKLKGLEDKSINDAFKIAETKRSNLAKEEIKKQENKVKELTETLRRQENKEARAEKSLYEHNKFNETKRSNESKENLKKLQIESSTGVNLEKEKGLNARAELKEAGLGNRKEKELAFKGDQLSEAKRSNIVEEELKKQQIETARIRDLLRDEQAKQRGLLDKEKLELENEKLEENKRANLESERLKELQIENVGNKELSKEKAKEQDIQKITEINENPETEKLNEEQLYNEYLQNGVSPIEAERAAKLRASTRNRLSQEQERAYAPHKDFIDKTTSSYKAFETEIKPRLLLLRNLASDEDLISPTANRFREVLGIPLGSLDNPNNELFQKTTQDLLKGLPETYGNRILKVEVDNFLKTIPQLENSPEGRRMIVSNLLKLGEMKEIYYNATRNLQKEYLQEGKKFPKDFQQEVFDYAKPMLNKNADEFQKMSRIKTIPIGTTAFFNPMGEIEFIPKELTEWAEQNGGKKIW